MRKVVPGLLRKGPILVCAEAPGADEEASGVPLTGQSGQLFDRLLKAVGLERGELSITNVFKIRPPKNEVGVFFAGKRESKGWPRSPFPTLKGKRLRPEYEEMVHATLAEIRASEAKVVVALGAVSLWAILGKDRITDYRGSPEEWEGRIVLPTFHPAAVLRDYSLLPTVTVDLDRARRFVQGVPPKISREVRVPENRGELEAMFAELRQAGRVALDTETERRQITMISLAPCEGVAYVVPLWDKKAPGWHRWSEETEVWFMQRLWELGQEVVLVMHNSLYDLQYLKECGIVPRYVPEDTMIAAHAREPELRKGLGYLASMHLDDKSWKYLGRKTKDEEKDEE